jgi:UDPglucose 6-dehydrogenase
MSSPRRRITVIGAGYVGVVTAVGLAVLDHQVELVEIDPARSAELEAGRLPLYEPGLEERYGAARERGLLTVSRTPGRSTDAFLVCVGTPIGDTAAPSDLSQLRGALASVTDAVRLGTPVVIRSTLPPGGTERLVVDRALPREHVLTNPEFLREGTALADFLRPSRIVIGTFPEASPAHVRLLTLLYAGIDAPVLVVDVVAAELIKNAAGAFLALRLALVNEVTALSEAYGTDAVPVLDAIGRDPRIGSQYLAPSLGFGGSCLPKELRVLEAAAQAHDLQLDAVASAARSNRAHADRFAARVIGAIDGEAKPRVGLLGLAFKAGTDDVRGSPAVELARRLLRAGIGVRACDPRAAENGRRALPEVEITDGPEAALDGADAAVVATEWPEFRALDWEALRERMRRPIVIDGRRLLDGAAMRALGFHYEAVGVPPARPAAAPVLEDPAPARRAASTD